MPVYNTEKYVGEAIRSVLDQTFGDFEFLIVDDGSTDGTVRVVEGFEDPRIRLIRQENQGCYPARNRAISEARGEYLANMDADDLLLPTRFEKQVRYLDEHPEVVLVGTKTYECDMEDKIRLPRRDFFNYEDGEIIRFEDTQSQAPFTLPSIMFRTSLVHEIGAYDDRLCYSADLDFVSRAALVGKIACLNDFLYVFRILPTSISGVGSRIQAEITRIIASAGKRAKNLGERQFTSEEVHKLKLLAAEKETLPRTSASVKKAFYEIRIATLYRVNGYTCKTLQHSLKALSIAPFHSLTNRKWLSNVLKSISFGKTDLTAR